MWRSSLSSDTASSRSRSTYSAWNGAKRTGWKVAAPSRSSAVSLQLRRGGFVGEDVEQQPHRASRTYRHRRDSSRGPSVISVRSAPLSPAGRSGASARARRTSVSSVDIGLAQLLRCRSRRSSACLPSPGTERRRTRIRGARSRACRDSRSCRAREGSRPGQRSWGMATVRRRERSSDAGRQADRSTARADRRAGGPRVVEPGSKVARDRADRDGGTPTATSPRADRRCSAAGRRADRAARCRDRDRPAHMRIVRAPVRVALHDRERSEGRAGAPPRARVSCWLRSARTVCGPTPGPRSTPGRLPATQPRRGLVGVNWTRSCVPGTPMNERVNRFGAASSNRQYGSVT